MINLLRSYDIKAAYENGVRIFDNAQIDYAQMEGFNLQNVVFKDCKFNFSTFRFSKLNNAKFINCTFFFGSFLGANIENTVFENTKLEFLRFDSAHMDKALFRKCYISYSTFIHTNSDAAKFENCTKFRVFDNASTITAEDLQGAASVLIPALESLDIEIKNHVIGVIAKVSSDLKVGNPLNVENSAPDTYSRKSVGGGYEKLSDILNEAISIYEKKNPYDKTKSYDQKNPYKKSEKR